MLLFAPLCSLLFATSFRMQNAKETATDLIHVESNPNGVAKITINRPQALNALTRSMMELLAQSIKRLGNDPGTHVIILTGSGRAFSAGVDLTAAESVFKGDVKDKEADPVAQMELCPVPIIGAINGHAITAGFEIALACDILIASPEAKFADTHCKFGIFPSWGLSQKLPRLIGANRAREVSFTAQPIDAKTAERWGLVSRVVDSDKLLNVAMDIASAIANNHQAMVKNYKSVLNDGLHLTLGEGRRLERDRAHEYYEKMPPQDFEAMQKFISSRSAKPKAKL